MKQLQLLLQFAGKSVRGKPGESVEHICWSGMGKDLDNHPSIIGWSREGKSETVRSTSGLSSRQMSNCSIRFFAFEQISRRPSPLFSHLAHQFTSVDKQHWLENDEKYEDDENSLGSITFAEGSDWIGHWGGGLVVTMVT